MGISGAIIQPDTGEALGMEGKRWIRDMSRTPGPHGCSDMGGKGEPTISQDTHGGTRLWVSNVFNSFQQPGPRHGEGRQTGESRVNRLCQRGGAMAGCWGRGKRGVETINSRI